MSLPLVFLPPEVEIEHEAAPCWRWFDSEYFQAADSHNSAIINVVLKKKYLQASKIYVFIVIKPGEILLALKSNF